MSQPAGSDGASPKLWFAVLIFWLRNGGVVSYAQRLLPSGLNSTVPALAGATVVVVGAVGSLLLSSDDELHPPTTRATARQTPVATVLIVRSLSMQARP